MKIYVATNMSGWTWMSREPMKFRGNEYFASGGRLISFGTTKEIVVSGIAPPPGKQRCYELKRVPMPKGKR